MKSFIYTAALGAAALGAASVGVLLYVEADTLQTTHEHKADDQAQEYAQKARVDARKYCIPLAREAEGNCIAERVEAARESQRNEYELQAQLTTSAWTRAMGVAAIIGMAAGMFGIGLVFVTFRETRRTANSAQASYDAFIELERARLIVEPTKVLWNPPHIMAVQVGMTNIGRSSAAALDAHVEFLDGLDFPGLFEETLRIDRAVAAGETGTFTAHVEDQRPFTMPPYIGGFVVYRSLFGRVHRSYFLAQIVPSRDSGSQAGFPTGYSVQSRGLHLSREMREHRFRWPNDD